MQCYKFMLLWQQNHHTVLDLPKKNIIFKNCIYMKREKKTIVHTNNSFQLWMINTWVTQLFRIYISMATYVTLRKIAIAKQLKYL